MIHLKEGLKVIDFILDQVAPMFGGVPLLEVPITAIFEESATTQEFHYISTWLNIQPFHLTLAVGTYFMTWPCLMFHDDCISSPGGPWVRSVVLDAYYLGDGLIERKL